MRRSDRAVEPKGIRHEYGAASIGSIAFQVLSHDQRACAIGKTSRGVFLRTSGRWVVFVSLEKHRGPLTLTVTGTRDQLLDVSPGSTAHVVNCRLIFPSIGTAITVEHDAVWRYPAARSGVLPFSERVDRLKHFALQAVAKKREMGFGGLLAHLLHLPLSDCASQGSESALGSILSLRDRLSSGNTLAVAGTMSRLLGMGRGLTPSGDDVIIGLLLGLNRWQDVLAPTIDLQDLNARVLDDAYRKTTSLSANLIECAAWGESDERVVAVVDSIFTGNPTPSECISGLLNWGGSSGTDALVGIALSLISHNDRECRPRTAPALSTITRPSHSRSFRR